MDVLGCLILFTMFEKIIGGTFYISNNTTDWTADSEQCKLAMPDLVYSGNKITVAIDDNINEEVWVGYYQENVILEYFGCVVKNNHTPVVTNANPRQCIATCQAGEIIGMLGSQCFCILIDRNDDNNVNILQPFCNNVCSSLSGIVCGGFQGNTSYISLYRSKEKADGKHHSVGNGRGRCMYYDKNGLNWAECNTSYAIICDNGSDVWIKQNNGNDYYDLNWATTTVACFKSVARPASNYTSIQKIQVNHQLWTGVVRSQTIRKYTDYTGHMGYTMKYGYLKRQSGSYELHFANLKTDPKKKSLCRNDIDEPSSVVGIVVGIIVSIVVVAAVVIAVVLFARKRGVQLPFLKKEKLTQSPIASRNNVGYAITGPVEIQSSTYTKSQDDYAEIDLKTTIDNEGTNSAVNNASETCGYTHGYLVPKKREEEQYNTIKTAVQKSDSDTYNPYNKLTLEESSEYDHVGNDKTPGGIPNRKTTESENAYNTISLGNSKLKTSTGESNNAYNITDDTDDAYNHINIPAHKIGRRDPKDDYDAI